MNRCAVVATHHKTGTVWMSSTFGAICRAINLPFRRVERSDALARCDLAPPIVVFQAHSDFSGFPWVLANDHRVLHLIRDPRDVVISAMHYHRVAKEAQLHRPRRKFGGKSYQQQINSLPTDRQRYLFEMENTSANVIRAMRAWDYHRPNCFECKYEWLIADESMTRFTAALRHLGFSEEETEIGRRKFWKHSIFGKKADHAGDPHIRSGSARQWRDVFDQDLGKAFIERFAEVLVTLGYEPDNHWVEELPVRSGLDREAPARARVSDGRAVT